MQTDTARHPPRIIESGTAAEAGNIQPSSQTLSNRCKATRAIQIGSGDTGARKDKKGSEHFVNPFNIVSKPFTDILEDEESVEDCAKVLVKLCTELGGNPLEWEFPDNATLDDLIVACTQYARPLVGGEVLEYETNRCISVLKYQESSFNPVLVPLVPIFRLRKNNPILSELLIAMLKATGIYSVFAIDNCSTLEMCKDWQIGYMYELEECESEEESIRKDLQYLWYNKRSWERETPDNWKSLIHSYIPKKAMYKKLKDIIIKASKTDFSILHLMHAPYNEEYHTDYLAHYALVGHVGCPISEALIMSANDTVNNFGYTDYFSFSIYDGKNPYKRPDPNLKAKTDKVYHLLVELRDILIELDKLQNKKNQCN